MRGSHRSCSVRQCYDHAKHPGVLYHSFPRDRRAREAWIRLCDRVVNPDTQSICSQHFLPSDYIPTANGKAKRLRKGVIPSQKLPANPKGSVKVEPPSPVTYLTVQPGNNQMALRVGQPMRYVNRTNPTYYPKIEEPPQEIKEEELDINEADVDEGAGHSWWGVGWRERA